MSILSTDFLRNLRKEKKSPAVQTVLKEAHADEVATIVITAAEIQCRIERQMPKQPSHARKPNSGSIGS